MILIAFGCDRCGAVEEQQLQGRSKYEEVCGRIKFPESWRYEDGFLYCGACRIKEESA